MSRRNFLMTSVSLGGTAGLWYAIPRPLRARLSSWTRLSEFDSTPPLLPHDPATERRSLWVARGGTPAQNIDSAVGKFGGMARVVGKDDLVILKLSAQWWNQGMTNVAAVKRVLEHILDIPGFAGEVVVFENTHFRMADGSGLSRAWVYPSERNVDVPGWNRLGDLIPHFQARRAPVGFVGLVDAGPSGLSDAPWRDPMHQHGKYGGDGRGPIEPGELRDGYHWDFEHTFRKRRSLVDYAQTPLTWPVFTSPRSGLLIDLRHGIFRRESRRRVPVDKKLTFITMTSANEHSDTGITCCCKSAMGIVDMSAGWMGTDPRIRDYQSVHYFGYPSATWRMAGPLAHFATHVRAPEVYITVAEWVAAFPRSGRDPLTDFRLDAAAAFHANTVVVGTDPVAVDWWCAKNILMPIEGARKELYNVDNPNSRVSRFLRYYREAHGSGTMDPRLIQVV
jgi:hypothetical protein